MPPGNLHPALTKRNLVVALAATSVLGLTPASAQAASGGMGWVPMPKVKRVTCVKDCTEDKRVQAGSRVRVVGTNLKGVRQVLFLGGSGKSDDRKVKVRPRSERSFLLRVPLEATTGPLQLDAGDYAKTTTKTVAILPPPPPDSSPELTPVPGPRDPAGPAIETGTSKVRAFVGSRNVVKFSYRVADDGPVNVQVDLVHPADGSVVRTWSPPPVTPGTVNEIVWDGLQADGATAPEGRYAFRLAASDSAGATAKSAQADNVDRDAFDLYGHIFPVRGRHNFGDSGAHFGAGRAGHSHQGQDVFARCGTRMVAARGGVVKFEQYHRAAGHYLVIDGDKTDVDYAYMHLTSESPFEPGDRVYTGQQIGTVGDSGNASGCHLHFEMWSGPGWYDGGDPFDPYPHLIAWDRVS